LSYARIETAILPERLTIPNLRPLPTARPAALEAMEWWRG